MAACGAFFAEAEGAEWEGNVVVNDEHLLGRPFVEGEDLLDGAAAQVHEGLRFKQNRAGPRELGKVALPLGYGLECRSLRSGEAVEHPEANIVAGVFILPPRITEADDE